MGEILRAGKKYQAGQDVAGWYVSEKMDGQRLFWDGGASVGLPVKEVPWVNSTWLRLHDTSMVCSGLWSRYLNPVICPLGVIGRLPLGIMLDLEAWAGRGKFTTVQSVVRRFDATISDWVDGGVGLWVHDIVPGGALFEDRSGGRGARMEYGWRDWWLTRIRGLRDDRKLPVVAKPVLLARHDLGFKFRLGALRQIHADCHVSRAVSDAGRPGAMTAAVAWDPWGKVGWNVAPHQAVNDYAEVQAQFDSVKAGGGEGLMLQNPTGLWRAVRTDDLLKVKASYSVNCTVTGWVEGKGKYIHMMGALVVQPEPGQDEPVTAPFQVGTGFDDAERTLAWSGTDKYPRWYPVGTVVEIGYMDVTADGLPREPRFLRVVN